MKKLFLAFLLLLPEILRAGISVSGDGGGSGPSEPSQIILTPGFVLVGGSNGRAQAMIPGGDLHLSGTDFSVVSLSGSDYTLAGSTTLTGTLDLSAAGLAPGTISTPAVTGTISTSGYEVTFSPDFSPAPLTAFPGLGTGSWFSANGVSGAVTNILDASHLLLAGTVATTTGTTGFSYTPSALHANDENGNLRFVLSHDGRPMVSSSTSQMYYADNFATLQRWSWGEAPGGSWVLNDLTTGTNPAQTGGSIIQVAPGAPPGSITVSATAGVSIPALTLEPGAGLLAAEQTHYLGVFFNGPSSVPGAQFVQSTDGLTFTPLTGTGSTFYYETPDGGLRDPSVMLYNGQYWLCCTTGTATPSSGGISGNSGYFDVASSPDLLHWTHVASPATAVSGTAANRTYAPEWFLDPVSGSPHVYVAIDTATTSGQTGFSVYEMHPTSGDFTQWSGPSLVPISGAAPGPSQGNTDPFMVWDDASQMYYLFQDSGNNPWVSYSPTLTGTFAASSYGAFAPYLNYGGVTVNGAGQSTAGEGYCLLHLPNGNWRIFQDHIGPSTDGTFGQYYADSPDLLSWPNPPVPVPTLSATYGAPYNAKHGTIIALNSGRQYQGAVPKAIAANGLTAQAFNNLVGTGSNNFAAGNDPRFSADAAGAAAWPIVENYRKTLMTATGTDIRLTRQYAQIGNGLSQVLAATDVSNIYEIWLTRADQNAGSGTTVYGLLGRYNATLSHASWSGTTPEIVFSGSGIMTIPDGSSPGYGAITMPPAPFLITAMGRMGDMTSGIAFGNYLEDAVDYGYAGNDPWTDLLYGPSQSGAGVRFAPVFNSGMSNQRWLMTWNMTSGTTASIRAVTSSGTYISSGTNSLSWNNGYRLDDTWNTPLPGLQIIRSTGATYESAILIVLTAAPSNPAAIEAAVRTGFDADLSIP